MKVLLWSVRRELWEHRWVWTVPLAIAAIVMIVFVGVTVAQTSSAGLTEVELRSLAKHHTGVFDLASRMLLMTGTIVSFVYCAESMHGERRDRALLFWKSWPVGDATTVAAKTMIAVVVVPALTLALLFAAEGIASVVLMPTGIALHAPMTNPLAATLEVIAATLYAAPVCAWIMMVSAWARRAVLLIAFLPALLAGVVEAMLRIDGPIGHALFWRGIGRYWPATLNVSADLGGMMTTKPAQELFRTPALWGGVAVAAFLIAVASKLRNRMIPLS